MDKRRVVVNDDYSIRVSKAITSDGGVYKCKATAYIEGKIVHASSSARVVVRGMLFVMVASILSTPIPLF